MRNLIKSGGAIQILGGAVLAAIIIGAIIWGFNDQKRWEDDCRKQGGRVSSHTEWVTTYDKDNLPHSNSNTTYYCFKDGRIVDIR